MSAPDERLPADMDAETVEAGLAKLETDLAAALAPDVVAALARLQAAPDARYIAFRARFKAHPDIRIGDVDAMVRKVAAADGGESAAPEGGPGIVEQIVDLVRASGTTFMGDDGEPYIEIDKGTHVEVWPMRSATLREWVAFEFYRTDGRAPKAQQLADAFTTLAGFATHEGETHEVALRVAVDPAGGYLLDVGDDAWRAIRLTTTGYQILDRSPVRFRRTKGTQALFEPEPGGTLEDLRLLVNIADEDLVLLVPAVLESLRPDTAYPVTEYVGDQGSAKSTTQQTLVGLIDPKKVKLRARPKCVEDVFVAARNGHAVHYNNLSSLSADLQDALCCLATGGGWAGRKLYTDDEESVFDAKRPVSMNGIVRLVTQPDLLSRTVPLRCPDLEPKDRISDLEYAERLARRGPRALDYLLTTFCRALKLLPEIEIERPPRLMDFARLGVAVARIMVQDDPTVFWPRGENGLRVAPAVPPEEPFMSRYRELLGRAVEQSLEAMPIIQAIVERVRLRGPIETTVGKLFDEMTEAQGSRRPSGWPKTSKALRDELDRARPALRSGGIGVTYPPGRRNGQQVRIGTLSSAPDESTSEETPSSPSQPSPIKSAREGGEGGEGDSGQTYRGANGEHPPGTSPEATAYAGASGR